MSQVAYIMKKVIFIIQGHDMPSSRVRVLNLLEKLKLKGYSITCVKYPKKKQDKFRLITSLKQYDIVYFQKKLPSLIDAFFIRKFSNKLIFDFDDSIYLKHERYKKQTSMSSQLKFRSIVSKADIVVAGNRILAEFASKYNQNIKIIPSVIETDSMPQKDYDKKNDKFIVGWVGGNINLSQLELLGDVFRRLSKDFPLEVRVISGKPPHLEGINMKFIPWTVETQDFEISQFDVGVMPLPDSPHARGKCAYKAIQYMAAGVVPVVSDVGVNSDVVIDVVTGMVAKDIDNFYDKILYLYKNKDILKSMGEVASRHVTDFYSVNSAVKLVDEIFVNI